jgi:hypothetical protein
VLTVAVYGDSPYGTSPTDAAQFTATPGFIDSINADPDVSLALHVGDIHSGKQYCTQAYDQAVYDAWTRFADPLVYTPGDNETTDCHKKAEGGGAYNPVTQQIDYVLDANGNPVDYAGGDPVANLDLIRSTFFGQPNLTLGARKQLVPSQALAYDRRHPTDRTFVENVLWYQAGVLFVTIDLPGGSNNVSSTAPCTWELATVCTPVWSIHPGYEVPNFHRVVVHGSTFPLEWLKVTIDTNAGGNGPNAFGPFSWERQIQP